MSLIGGLSMFQSITHTNVVSAEWIIGGMAIGISAISVYVVKQHSILNTVRDKHVETLTKIQDDHNTTTQKVVKECTEAITKNTGQTERAMIQQDLMMSFLKDKLA